MPDFDSRELKALQNALSALTSLQVAIQIVGEHLQKLQREVDVWGWDLRFNLKREFIGVSRRGSDEIEYSADSIHCIEIASHCEWLPKHVDSLWKAHPEADKALGDLPANVLQRLDALTHSPWLATVRRHCLDQILAWPGERHHQTSLAAEKVFGSVTQLLEKAKSYDPFPTWKRFEALILDYKSDLFAVRDAVLIKPAKVNPSGPDRHGLVAVDIRRVIQDANRACKAWHVLGGAQDGRMLAHRPDGVPAPHSDSQPKCIRAWSVPSRDNRKDIEYIEEREGKERVVMYEDKYRQAFKHYWDELDDARRRLVTLLNGGDIAVLDCDLDTRYTLRVMWTAVEAIPTQPPEFRIEGKQDFFGGLSSVLGWMADELESRIGSTKADATDTARSTKPKRSTERGEGRAKLIPALTKHHEYADGGCLNLEPVVSNELARIAGVSNSTASDFFTKQFGGHTKYRAICTDKTRLVAALKLLNQEFTPHYLFGAKPQGEGERKDEE